jgi:iron-sulfur cluster repair protein YtfE (RIC family)
MFQDQLTVSPASVTELLTRDHSRLDSILADVKRCLAAGDLRGASVGFSEFRGGLERHMDAEEEVLFPAFDAVTGAPGTGPTHVMRLEHAELRRLMAEVTDSLARGGEEGHVTPLAALTARIYAHNGKEERILYPAADRAIGDATLEELVRRLQSS